MILNDEPLTAISVDLLAGSFPTSMRVSALDAASVVYEQLCADQWASCLHLNVGNESIEIPHRLRFENSAAAIHPGGVVEQMIACLQTQSCDGFQRQRALQVILADVKPWSAPFVTALVGEYIVEIIDDIYAALSAQNISALASFIDENALYWEITKQRVASYWDVYYRGRYARQNYSGFKVIHVLEAKLSENRH
jgi:hypothetical protein